MNVGRVFLCVVETLYVVECAVECVYPCYYIHTDIKGVCIVEAVCVAELECVCVAECAVQRVYLAIIYITHT